MPLYHSAGTIPARCLQTGVAASRFLQAPVSRATSGLRRSLPPLQSLRAFEAAARHLSFKQAAEELHVSPGAVSQQIKALEAHLGVLLFRRLTRALELTGAGARVQPGISEGFVLFQAAVEDVRRRTDSRRLWSVPPALKGSVQYESGIQRLYRAVVRSVHCIGERASLRG